MEQGFSSVAGRGGMLLHPWSEAVSSKEGLPSGRERQGRGWKQCSVLPALLCLLQHPAELASWDESAPSSAAHALSRMCWAQSSPSSTLASTRFSQKYTIQFLMSNLILRTLSSFSLERWLILHCPASHTIHSRAINKYHPAVAYSKPYFIIFHS